MIALPLLFHYEFCTKHSEFILQLLKTKCPYDDANITFLISRTVGTTVLLNKHGASISELH